MALLRGPCLTIFLYFLQTNAKHRHSRSAAALKPAPQAGFNAAALREWRFVVISCKENEKKSLNRGPIEGPRGALLLQE